MEYVAAEKELAIYHAHQAGVPIDDIAHRVRQSADDVRALADSHARAKEIPDLEGDCPRMLCRATSCRSPRCRRKSASC